MKVRVIRLTLINRHFLSFIMAPLKCSFLRSQSQRPFKTNKTPGSETQKMLYAVCGSKKITPSSHLSVSLLSLTPYTSLPTKDDVAGSVGTRRKNIIGLPDDDLASSQISKLGMNTSPATKNVA